MHVLCIKSLGEDQLSQSWFFSVLLTIGRRGLKTLESFCRWWFHVLKSVLQTASVHLCVFPVVPQSKNLVFIVFTPPCF